MIFQREPALWLAVLEAALAAAVLFGLPLTLEQRAAIIVLARAVFALVTRQLVTPIAAPRLPGYRLTKEPRHRKGS